MKLVILDPRPPELQALIDRRQQLGVDLYDEVWKGSHHVVPAPNAEHAYVGHRLAIVLDPYARAAGLAGTDPFNLGEPEDYRVPDRGYHRGAPSGVWVATAAIVVEIVSPDDETYEKFDFYARHGVEELLIADPAERTVAFWRRTSDERYELTPASALLGVSADHLTAAIDWPAPG
ncbi:MAG TPA: Uma2 family endonuclease [Acidimicrobiales bacterium]|nr:Uma2 family endonuclease [Acidimicrobiales bacterium]